MRTTEFKYRKRLQLSIIVNVLQSPARIDYRDSCMGWKRKFRVLTEETQQEPVDLPTRACKQVCLARNILASRLHGRMAAAPGHRSISDRRRRRLRRQLPLIWLPNGQPTHMTYLVILVALIGRLFMISEHGFRGNHPHAQGVFRARAQRPGQ